MRERIWRSGSGKDMKRNFGENKSGREKGRGKGNGKGNVKGNGNGNGNEIEIVSETASVNGWSVASILTSLENLDS
jgi:hypothetical protein